MTLRLRFPDVDDPDFLAHVDHSPVAVLRLIGSVDSAATRELAQLLETLHHELRERRTRELVVDMHEVDSMHTACVKVLFGWLETVRALDEAVRYRVRVKSNPAIAWQKNTLPAFACFDPALVIVE